MLAAFSVGSDASMQGDLASPAAAAHDNAEQIEAAANLLGFFGRWALAHLYPMQSHLPRTWVQL